MHLDTLKLVIQALEIAFDVVERPPQALPIALEVCQPGAEVHQSRTEGKQDTMSQPRAA